MGRRASGAAAGEPPSTSATQVVVLITDFQAVSVDSARIRRAAQRAAQSEGACGEISVSLVDSDRIAELNAQYMGHAGPTDVLAFPIDGRVEVSGAAPTPMIGELVVCPQVAARQADDVDAELDLLVTHGVLHLLGYDHDTEANAAVMRQREFELIGQSGAQA